MSVVDISKGGGFVRVEPAVKAARWKRGVALLGRALAAMRMEPRGAVHYDPCDSFWDADAMTEGERRDAVRQDEVNGMETPALDGYKLRMKLGDWLWVPLLVFVIAAMACFCADWFIALIHWLRAGGWQ